MVAAGYCVELIFGVTGLIPDSRNATVLHTGIGWNYSTTWLNIAALAPASGLVLRFLRTGGPHMLTQMQENGSPERS